MALAWHPPGPRDWIRDGTGPMWVSWNPSWDLCLVGVPQGSCNYSRHEKMAPAT